MGTTKYCRNELPRKVTIRKAKQGWALEVTWDMKEPLQDVELMVFANWDDLVDELTYLYHEDNDDDCEEE